ncbi:TATA-box-binding protein C [Halorussus vallis]|nr:TATA-box-binding protein C [Halorussus vallis]
MGSGDLGRELDLDSVIQALGESYSIDVNRQSDSMVTLRLMPEGPALTLYRTGTYQIRGTDSRDSLFQANQGLLDALKSIGVNFSDPSFEQKNAVYLEDLETSVQLEALSIHLGLENMEYEPEQFPGVIYRPPDLEVVNLIFATGKTIISGTIHDEIAEKSAEHLRKQIAELH